MPVETVPLKEWLRSAQVVNDLHLRVMTLRFDLDGAEDAGQHGLAWWTQGELLISSVELYLVESGLRSPTPRDRMDRSLAVLRTLERLNPELASGVWELWLRPTPAPDDTPAEVERTIEFVSGRLGQSYLFSRRETILRWASHTRILRTVARSLGIAQSDDWYLNDSTTSAPEMDWYDEVLTMLEEVEQR